ncbi:MAG: GAP family protein [Tetrasphaera sp.]
MTHLLSTLMPLCLAAGISPVMFSEQLLLVSGRGGRRSATAFAAGTVAVLAVLTALVVTVGGSLSLPRTPTLSARLDVALGGLLLALAALVRKRAPRPPKPATTEPDRSVASAFGFGVFSMATNLTTLPLVIAAAKDIAASGVSVVWMALAIALLLIGGCLPAWTPLVLERVPGGQRTMAAISDTLDRHGRSLVVLALGGAGVLFVSKGLLAL